jgi:hypothetical protein
MTSFFTRNAYSNESCDSNIHDTYFINEYKSYKGSKIFFCKPRDVAH